MMIHSYGGCRLPAVLLLCAALCGWPAREAAAAVNCMSTMSDLNFGAVDLVSGGTSTANATLNFTCENTATNTVHVRVCFSIGDGSASIASGGNDFNPRIMRDGSANELKFQLYQSVTQAIWGSIANTTIPDPYDTVITIGGRTNSVNGTVTGNASMRGEILTNQAAMPPGTYQTSFDTNHTALRYTNPVDNINAVPSSCTSAGNGTDIFNFNVSATIIKSCLVSADTLDFGTVDGVASAANTDAQSSIRVTCSRPTAYTVSLIPSNNSSIGSSAMKGLAAGNTDAVPYRLYRNASRNQPWGNQVGTNTRTGTGNGLPQTLTVFGRVAGLPNVQPDNYKDTVTVNVNY